MILSDLDISRFLQTGDIVIEPFTQEHIKGGSYTFTLNEVLHIPKTSGIVDANNPEVDFEKIIIGEQGFILEPGMFVLGQTAEQLSVSQKLACMLDARTTLARIGLNVLQGSTFIQPGQSQSHETLEINNISKNPIRIYAGMKIVKGIFFLLHSPSEQNYGKNGAYAKQSFIDPK